MKTVFATLLLIALVQTQHVDEDKQTLILAGKIQDLKVAANKNVTIPDSDKKNGSKTEKPEKLPTPITPVPKPVSNDNNTEKDESKSYTTTTQSALPSPTPKQLNPAVDVLKDIESEVFESKPSVPKKGADPKDEKLSVPKKGADPKDEILSVPKKGADPKNEKSSFPKIAADLNGERKSEPGKNKTSPNMLTLSTKKEFIPAVNEASMDFSESSTTPNGVVMSSVTSFPKNDLSTYISKESEPVEPLTGDTTTTEYYTTTNFKPTAATDMKGKGEFGDEENISYTPAVVGVVLLVVIFITVIVVAYRRLQDVWMRRHYARMDFLIDGMYDV